MKELMKTIVRTCSIAAVTSMATYALLCIATMAWIKSVDNKYTD